MRTKRVFFALILAGILAAIWVVSIRSYSGEEIRIEQESLWKEADAFAEKELYVRAIPLYKEALTYHTEYNHEIEKDLLASYWEYGSYSDYNQLVEKRVEEQSAEKQEYLNTAESYIASLSLEDAIKLLKKGISQFTQIGEDVSELSELYEKYRYTYQMRPTIYKDVVPSETNQVIPALSEDGWVYIDASGRDIFKETFEYASLFNRDGFAVVKKDGMYMTINSAGDKYGIDEVLVDEVYGMNGPYIIAKKGTQYSYFNYDFQNVGSKLQYNQITRSASGVSAVRQGNYWGIIKDSEIINNKPQFPSSENWTEQGGIEDIAVSSLQTCFVSMTIGDEKKAVAMAKTGGLYYMIDASGQRVLEDGFTDARAPESDGYIAVCDSDGKWGFIDQSGNLVISYQYDDAYSFSNHLAAVKQGGKWDYISEYNERVTDFRFEDAYPFHSGIAQAKLNGTMCIITLEYAEE